MATMSALGFQLLRDWEKCILHAYDDADPHADHNAVEPGTVVRGTLTIGYGHTGRDVVPGLIWTRDQAEAALQQNVAAVSADIAPLITTNLTDNQFSAFVCLTFNIGHGGFATSTALRLANQSSFNRVPDAIRMWNKTRIDGVLVESQGLKNRREAECTLWNTP